MRMRGTKEFLCSEMHWLRRGPLFTLRHGASLPTTSSFPEAISAPMTLLFLAVVAVKTTTASHIHTFFESQSHGPVHPKSETPQNLTMTNSSHEKTTFTSHAIF